METIELIQAISPATNSLGAAFYFHPATLAKGKEQGLDGFRFYVLGRGGVLGDVEASVVTSAFAYFHPNTVEKIWNSAKEKMAPRAAAALYGECCADLGRSKLSSIENAVLDGYVDAAEAVVAATDVAGLALYAGWAAEPRVDDAAGRAMQLLALLRELRGSAHIVALLASGVAAPVAHVIKRPDDATTFGWDPAPEIGPDDPVKCEAAESLTDRLLVPSYGGLTDEQAAALVAGTEAIGAALAA
jgi:uncharacterized membrane protein